MKLRFLFGIAALGLVMSNCSNDEFIDSYIKQNCQVVTAVMENDVNSRSNATDEGSFTWATGDEIAVYTSNGNWAKGILQTGAGSASATFSITYADGEASAGYAIYPYNDSHSVSGESVTINLPAEYDYSSSDIYTENTNAPMIATFDEESSTPFAFKHVGAVLRFNVKNVPVGANQFVFTAIDRQIAGQFVIDENGQINVVSSDTDGTITIKFKTLESVAENMKFFIPIPTGEYNGMKIEVKDEEGTVLGASSSTATATITRKKLMLGPTLSIVAGEMTETVKVWDGETIVPLSDMDEAASKVLYQVNHAEELAWVLRTWNGGSTSPSRPTTIELLNDIDFGNHEIYFDMDEVGGFHSVTLEGNNHTIKNYKVSGVNKRAALFPQTSGITIQNLTIDGAVVGNEQTAQDLYAGALIAIATDQKPTPYTTVINNVTVQNSTIKGVNKVGGLIGQANGIHVVSDAEVKNTTITGYGTDAGSLGGLYGYLQVEGESSFTNSKMTGGAIICEDGQDEAKRGSSGFIGTLHMGKASSSLALNNCSVSGTDLTKSNTEVTLNDFVGTIRTGTSAELFIDGEMVYYFVKVWDGSSLVRPADKDNAASRVLYKVGQAEELAWVLRTWNGGSTSPSRPTTIELLNDIDFGNHEIYFDMDEVGGFHSVTLEGNNHTIKNYKVSGVNKRAALFPQTSGITIQNLTIDGAVVGNEQTAQDLYAGALIAIATDQKPTPYTTVINNVTVQNSTIKGVNKVGGLIGQANGIHVVSDAEVKNTTITGYGTDAGSLGGLYGYLQVEGESSFTNSKMTGGAIICENGEDKVSRANSGFIGTLGMTKASSKLNLNDCRVSYSTTIQNKCSTPLHDLVGGVRASSSNVAELYIDGNKVIY